MPGHAPPVWTCPDCKLGFERERQPHVCLSEALMAVADKGNKAIDNEIADRLEAAGADADDIFAPQTTREAVDWAERDRQADEAEPEAAEDGDVVLGAKLGHVHLRLHQSPDNKEAVLLSSVDNLDPVDALSVMLEGAHQFLGEIRHFAHPAYRLAANLHRIAGDKAEVVAEEILAAILEVARRHGLAEEVEGALAAERVMRAMDKARETEPDEPQRL